MGCGKSSIGRKLSALLCCRFVDLDDAIEERAGRSIPEIFSTEGEAYFRKLEKEVLTDIIRLHSQPEYSEGIQLVLALGGGAVMTPECEKIVHEETSCIYLLASVDTLISHLEGQSSGRPLLQSVSSLREHITVLMSKRAATYERTAHKIIDTNDKSIDDIALYLYKTL